MSRGNISYQGLVNHNKELVNEVFAKTEGYTVNPDQSFMSPLGGQIDFALLDKPETATQAAINVALELGKILPDTTTARFSSWGWPEFIELVIEGSFDEDLRKRVRDIPPALGIIREEPSSIRLVIDPDNLGARYQDMGAVVSDSKIIQELHGYDVEKLRSSGVVNEMTKTASKQIEAWNNVVEPELAVVTSMEPMLHKSNDNPASLIYSTELILSSGVEGLDDLLFRYVPGSSNLHTTSFESETEDDSKSICIDLTEPQRFLLRAITTRNQYTIHVKLFEHLSWLASADPEGQANYAKMRGEGLIPKKAIASTDPDMINSNLIGAMASSLADIDEGWANALEDDQLLFLNSNICSLLDPKSGELKIHRPIKVALGGFQPLFYDGSPVGSSNIGASFAYELGNSVITPYSSNRDELLPEAQITLSPEQAELLGRLITGYSCYLQGATIDQLAKGQPLHS